MSSFIMPENGFRQLATKLYEVSTTNVTMRDGYKRAVLSFLFDNIPTNPSAENIQKQIQLRINNLISANEHAVSERYGNDGRVTDHYLEFSDRISCYWSDVQLIKNLECLRYQMCEGSVPGTVIYQKLNKLIGDYCEAYVSNRDEYEKANWGW